MGAVDGTGSQRPEDLPHSEECERAVLGAILLEPQLAGTVALRPKDFYSERHERIFAAMRHVHKMGAAVDVRTVQAHLEMLGQFDAVGGIAYLASLDLDLPDLGGFDTYVEVVKDRSQRRQFIEAARDSIRDCQGGGDLSGILERQAAIVTGLRDRNAYASPSAVTIADFLALKLPPRRWLARGLLQEKDTCMLHGWRGLGKSHFAAGLAHALASGTDFLRYKIEEPVGVLYVDGEMPREDLQLRFSAIEHSSTCKPTAPLLLLARDMSDVPFPSLASREGQKMVELNLAQGVQVIILDSLSTLCQSDERENDSGSWAVMQEWLLRLRGRGYTVLLVHHDGKNREQRGTSARETILSQSVHLVQPQDYHPSQGARFEVHLKKARGVWGDEAAPFEAQLESTPDGRQTWTVRALEGVEDRIRAAQEAGNRSVRKIASASGLSKSTAHRRMKKMEKS